MSENSATVNNEHRLRRMLDAMGLRYNLRYDDAGKPYAGFNFESEPGEFVHYTARIIGRVMQFAADHVLSIPAVEGDLWKVNEVNQDWGLGCIFYNYDEQCYEASEAIYMADDSLIDFELSQLLRNLNLAAWHLRKYPLCFYGITPDTDDSPPVTRTSENEIYSFRSFYDAQMLTLLPTDNGASMQDIEEVLRRLGHSFQTSHGGAMLSQGFTEDDGHEFYVEFFKTGERFLYMRARHGAGKTVTEDEAALRKLQGLNSSLPIGSAAIDRQLRQIYYLVGMPLAWVKIETSLISWMIDLAASTMARIDQQFHGASSR